MYTYVGWEVSLRHQVVVYVDFASCAGISHGQQTSEQCVMVMQCYISASRCTRGWCNASDTEKLHPVIICTFRAKLPAAGHWPFPCCISRDDRMTTATCTTTMTSQGLSPNNNIEAVQRVLHLHFFSACWSFIYFMANVAPPVEVQQLQDPQIIDYTRSPKAGKLTGCNRINCCCSHCVGDVLCWKSEDEAAFKGAFQIRIRKGRINDRGLVNRYSRWILLM